MKNTENGMDRGGVKIYVVHYWGKIMKIKTAMAQMRFYALAQVMVAVFRLLHRNADCERAFCVILKVHIDCRHSLKASLMYHRRL